jgi:fructose-specific PTS system IIA-like component
VEFTFACPLQNGLHARPASHLAEIANNFDADFVLTNLRSGATANAKSVLSLIAADVRAGDECRLRATGRDAKTARDTLVRFIERDLPACDEPLAEFVADAGARAVALPRALRSASVSFHAGLAVSRGVGRGKVVIIGGAALPRVFVEEAATDSRRERERFVRASSAVRARMGEMIARGASRQETAILKAHLAMIDDGSLAERVDDLIAEGRAAGQAVLEACESFAGVLRRSENAYLRERAVDVEGICLQLLEEIGGAKFQTPALKLEEPSIVVAATIAPQQLLALDRNFLRALILESAGTTSHAVILARTLGIPTLVGVHQASRALEQVREVVVDANRGFVVTELTPHVERFYERETETLRRRQVVLARGASAQAMTTDGRRIEVAANVSSAEEASIAFERGADGVGLFRTEILFAGRDRAPEEDEQFEMYAHAARAARDRAVIIRTLDVGGDKPLAYLSLPREENPFLGYRGARIYAEHVELLRAQLRAILRASVFGRVRLMIPLVSSLEEVLWFKSQVAAARDELSTRGVEFDPAMPVGMMIEVPSVAFLLEELCDELDFFSIGTNDLAQYFFAAARDNAKVSSLANVRQPNFLRLLKKIVGEVRARGKWTGMCGEMAGDARNLPLLVGLALDEISAASSETAVLKETISRLSASDCEELLARAVECRRVEEVEELLTRASSIELALPLLDERLIVVGGESASKEEAIREMIDEFYVAGRVEDRESLEEAVWAREATYSTGVGYGFAIPHCKTDAVAADSIGVLKLRQPVAWDSIDGEPVSVVILLAMRESGAAAQRHLQVFARLARKLMSEEFRERLLRAEDARAVLDCLTEEL